MKLYTCSAIKELIDKYMAKDGNIVEVKSGCLGYGLIILYGDSLKTAVIQEVPLNEWSSAHKLRMYNKIPKKYKEMIEKAQEKGETDSV